MPTTDLRAATKGFRAVRKDSLRVAIAHDWLVKYGGAERCLDEMLTAFPDADIYTSVLDAERVPKRYGRARPSFLQRIPGATRHHELLLPLMPLAWGARRPLDGYDVVLSSSYACAKAVRTAPGVPHVCYCHAPMRYAWDFASEQHRVVRVARPVVRSGMAVLRRWDVRASRGVTTFVANSTAVSDRIRRYYGRDSVVVFPPVKTDFFTPGLGRTDDFLFCSRLVSFKRPEIVVEAFRGLPYVLHVVGDGRMRAQLEADAPPNVIFHGELRDADLRTMYRSARALVHPANDEFGIVMAEALSCGTPIIAVDHGGAQDLVVDGVTGWRLRHLDIADLRAAVRRAVTEELETSRIRAFAEQFSADRFRAQLVDVIYSVVGGVRA